MASSFTAISFLGRWVFALALVFGTYNPTEYSYYRWAFGSGSEFGPLVAIVGLLLLTAWIIYLRATFLSMGWLGVILGAALFTCVVWLLVDQGWLSLKSHSAMTWVGLLLLSLILAIGMSWSHVRRRLTGQFDVDEMDD